jgi:hypothetical protein
VMLKNPGYGSPRVAIALKINEKRAARVMKKFGLRPARRSKNPYKPADQGRESLALPCILSTLSPMAPDVVWASDSSFCTGATGQKVLSVPGLRGNRSMIA